MFFLQAVLSGKMSYTIGVLERHRFLMYGAIPLQNR